MNYIIPIFIGVFCLLSSILGWAFNPWSKKDPPKDSDEGGDISSDAPSDGTGVSPNTISENPTGNEPIRYIRPSRKDNQINYTNTKVIIKEVPGECPNCPACKSQECPKVVCPKCPDYECDVSEKQLKIASEEIKYLKWMARFLGALLRRENAVNRVMGEHCTGTFSMVPIVQKADHETQFVQSHIQKNNKMLKYFQTHFSEYSGVKSKPYTEIL
jgi:hypothetical protein